MFRVKLQGMAGLKAEFAAASKNLEKIVSNNMEQMAQEWVERAVIDAPADEGRLRNAITYIPRSPLSFEIVAQVYYAAYMEFGTRGNYRAIPGTEAIAQQFKGRAGGTFEEMLKAITEWVRRKGITGTYSVKTRRRTGNKARQAKENQGAAWAIAVSILKNGVKAQPYFFKQKDIVWPAMIRRIERDLKRETKVSVTLPGNINRPPIVTI